MVVDYDKESVFTKQLDIVDPGNCAIRCIVEEITEYYLLIKTVYGRTYVLKFGPIMVDLDSIEDFFTVSYTIFDYKEGRIQKEITKLLQDDKKPASEAEVITVEEALEAFPNIRELYLQIGED